MVTADHGPAVSGAHNTIVCARAGKDLVSSVVSGLLTIVSKIPCLTFNPIWMETHYSFCPIQPFLSDELLSIEMALKKKLKIALICLSG